MRTRFLIMVFVCGEHWLLPSAMEDDEAREFKTRAEAQAFVDALSAMPENQGVFRYEVAEGRSNTPEENSEFKKEFQRRFPVKGPEEPKP